MKQEEKFKPLTREEEESRCTTSRLKSICYISGEELSAEDATLRKYEEGNGNLDIVVVHRRFIK